MRMNSWAVRHFISTCLALLVATAVWAQAPVGTISGTVRDQSDAVVPGATITIKHVATGAERHLTSNADGTFSAPALAVGAYDVRAELSGFRTQQTEVTVATGRVATVDIHMAVGAATEVVNVAANAIHVETEAHAVSGVITRQEIQELPLNGRSFLQLAFLEPGVTASPGSTSQYNSLFSVSILGGDSNKTAITVDGGNIRNSIEGNTGMNFSQEVVEEFQLSSANYDLSTGITSVGSVNIVTRTGSNDLKGSTYYFFRNNDMAAYPVVAAGSAQPRSEILAQQSRDLARRPGSQGSGSSSSATTSTPIRKASCRSSPISPRPARWPASSRIRIAGICSARASTGERTTATRRSCASRTTRTAASDRAVRPRCRPTGCATSTSRSRPSSV